MAVVFYWAFEVMSVIVRSSNRQKNMLSDRLSQLLGEIDMTNVMDYEDLSLFRSL